MFSPLLLLLYGSQTARDSPGARGTWGAPRHRLPWLPRDGCAGFRIHSHRFLRWPPGDSCSAAGVAVGPGGPGLSVCSKPEAQDGAAAGWCGW